MTSLERRNFGCNNILDVGILSWRSGKLFPDKRHQGANHNFECGQLGTVEHVLKECPLYPAERDLLKKVFPELDSKILFDTKKGLGAVVQFLESLPQLL